MKMFVPLLTFYSLCKLLIASKKLMKTCSILHVCVHFHVGCMCVCVHMHELARG